MMSPHMTHAARRIEQADLGAQAAVGEEERQQQHDDEILELVGEDLREAVLLRARSAPKMNAPKSAWMPISSVTQLDSSSSSSVTGDEVLAEPLAVGAARRQPADEAAARRTASTAM